jgi:hypothetical protein
VSVAKIHLEEQLIFGGIKQSSQAEKAGRPTTVGRAHKEGQAHKAVSKIYLKCTKNS